MCRWIAHIVGSLGYVEVGLLMALENVVLPLPSKIIIPLAGFVAAEGRLALWGVIAAGTAGSVIGPIPLWALARAIGEERMKEWIERHGQWLLIADADLDRPKRWFDRHGDLAVLFSQMVPGVRGLISLPAGYAGMHIVPFIFNAIGTAIWCTALAYAGYLLGANFRAVHDFIGPATWAIVGLLVIAGAWWISKRWHAVHQRKQQRAGRK